MILHKGIKYVMILLSVVAVIFAFMVMSGSQSTISNILVVGYITLFAGLLFILLFSILNTFSKPETLKKTLVSLGLFVAVILVAYLFSSGEAIVKNGVEIVSASASKWIDVGLKVFYILSIISIIAIVFSGIKKYSK